MPDNPITRDQADQIIEDYFIKLAKLEANICQITNEEPLCGGIYRTWPEDEDVWYVYPEPRGGSLGGSRVIVISRKTGKILLTGKWGNNVTNDFTEISNKSLFG